MVAGREPAVSSQILWWLVREGSGLCHVVFFVQFLCLQCIRIVEDQDIVFVSTAIFGIFGIAVGIPSDMEFSAVSPPAWEDGCWLVKREDVQEWRIFLLFFQWRTLLNYFVDVVTQNVHQKKPRSSPMTHTSMLSEVSDTTRSLTLHTWLHSLAISSAVVPVLECIVMATHTSRFVELRVQCASNACNLNSIATGSQPRLYVCLTSRNWTWDPSSRYRCLDVKWDAKWKLSWTWASWCMIHDALNQNHDWMNLNLIHGDNFFQWK